MYAATQGARIDPAKDAHVAGGRRQADVEGGGGEMEQGLIDGPDYGAAQIKRLRLCFKAATQAVFAADLNTSTAAVQKWERGQQHPNGSSMKLLNLADRKGLDVLA